MWKQTQKLSVKPSGCVVLKALCPGKASSGLGDESPWGWGQLQTLQMWDVGNTAVLTPGLQLPADIFFPPACADSFHSKVSSSPDLLHSLLPSHPAMATCSPLSFQLRIQVVN